MVAEKKSVLTVLRALEMLSKELGVDAPLTYALTLLYVANAGDNGLEQSQLASMLDLSPSAAGRAAQALSRFHWLKDASGTKKPGLDLIISEQNPTNFRMRTLTLSPTGKKLIEKVGGITK
jgi:DNA-binding MarR family transcriptional regulator